MMELIESNCKEKKILATRVKLSHWQALELCRMDDAAWDSALRKVFDMPYCEALVSNFWCHGWGTSDGSDWSINQGYPTFVLQKGFSPDAELITILESENLSTS